MLFGQNINIYLNSIFINLSLIYDLKMNRSNDISLIDISIKAWSKKEVYLVLTIEGGLYLPLILDSNRSYLKSIISGKKKLLYLKDIKCIKVPQIKSLNIIDILVFSKKQTNIDEYLPSYEYDKFPNRDWLCNVINIIVLKEYNECIASDLNQREKLKLLDRGLEVGAIPKIVNIYFHDLKMFLLWKKSHYLLRKQPNFRKRTVLDREIEDKEEIKVRKKKWLIK